ncbi:hypothetical protein C8R45DRAFT_966743 [Mycena sanguinolenta]|nr:hypothetical protein C8R45DRAFT_966743 [Mycena sanguinolenta]
MCAFLSLPTSCVAVPYYLGSPGPRLMHPPLMVTGCLISLISLPKLLPLSRCAMVSPEARLAKVPNALSLACSLSAVIDHYISRISVLSVSPSARQSNVESLRPMC